MLVAFGDNDRRPTVANGFDDLGDNQAIARLVLDELFIQIMELHAHVRICDLPLAESCWTDKHGMLERAGGCLFAGVHTMPDGTALHENDRMMAVFPRNGCRKSDDKSSLKSAGDLLKAMSG